ncbi:MAG: hypothetical protein PHS82_09530 [Lachnospiraceae bacterium]|nr:hypothetical protein [Lachnospiraceae bacterium]
MRTDAILFFGIIVIVFLIVIYRKIKYGFWGKKELMCTFSIAQRTRVKDMLDEQGITYSCKTVNRRSPSPFSAGNRSRTGTFGENLENEYEYYLYVKKEDYARACSLLNTISNR